MVNKGSQKSVEKKKSLLPFFAVGAVLLVVAVYATRPKTSVTEQSQVEPQVPVQPEKQLPASDPAIPQSETPNHTPTDAYHYPMPPYFEDPAQAEPLPPTLPPETVLPYARAAYEVAQRKPKLLTQLPCFCYCNRWGHKSLHSCYVDTHAEQCNVCIKEAMEADYLDSLGFSGPEIRKQIVEKYHPRDPRAGS